jgi:hypothetical protein
MTIVRAEGDVLVVPEGARIPKVCVRCGATTNIVRREQTYAMGSASTTPWLGGAIGAGVAAFARNVFRDRLGLQALFIVVVITAAIVFAVVVHKTARKITLSVPLCPEHDAAIERATRARIPVLGGIGLGLAIALAGMGVDSMGTVLFGMALFGIVLVVALATRMKDAWIPVAGVKEDGVRLRVGVDLAKSLASRAEKREAKRAAKQSTNDRDGADESASDDAESAA